MASNEVELERMIVRILGDTTDFVQKMDQIGGYTKAIAKDIDNATKDIEAAFAKVGQAATATGKELALLQLQQASGAKAMVANSTDIMTAEGMRLQQQQVAAKASIERIQGIFDQIDAEKQRAEALKEGAKVTAKYMTEEEDRAAKLAKLKDLFDKGGIDPTTYGRATYDVSGTKASIDEATKQREIAAANAVAAAEKAKALAVAEAAKVTAKYMTDEEVRLEKMYKLRTQLARGDITPETFGRAAYDVSGDKARDIAAQKAAEAQKVAGQQQYISYDTSQDQKAAAIRASQMTAMERQGVKQNELNVLLREGRLTVDEHAKAMKNAMSGTDDLSAGMAKLTAIAIATSAALGLVSSAGNALAKFGAMESIQLRLAAAAEMNGQAVESTMGKYKAFTEEMRANLGVSLQESMSLLQLANSQGIAGDAAIRVARSAKEMSIMTGQSAQAMVYFAIAVEKGEPQMIHHMRQLRGIVDPVEKMNKALYLQAQAHTQAMEMAKGYSVSLAKLHTTFTTLSLHIGEFLAGIVKPLINAFNSLDESTKMWVAGILIAITATIAFTAAIIALSGTLKAISLALAAATMSVYRFTVALVTNPIGAAVITIIAVATAVYYLAKAFDNLLPSVRAANAEMAKGARETSETSAEMVSKRSDILERASHIEGPERRRTLERARANAQEEVAARKAELDKARKAADIGWGEWFITKPKTIEKLNADVDNAHTLFNEAEKSAEAFGNAIKKLDLNEVMKGEVRKLQDHVEMQVKTVGLTEGQKEIEKLREQARKDARLPGKSTDTSTLEKEILPIQAKLAFRDAITLQEKFYESTKHTIMGINEQIATFDTAQGPVKAYKVVVEELDKAEKASRLRSVEDARKYLAQVRRDSMEAMQIVIQREAELAAVKSKKKAEDVTEGIGIHIATIGMSTAESEIYKRQFELSKQAMKETIGLNDAIGAAIRRRMMDQAAMEAQNTRVNASVLAGLERQKELATHGESLRKEMLTPAEKLSERRKELSEMFKAGEISATTYTRAVYKAIAANHELSGSVQGVELRTSAYVSAQQKYMLGALASPVPESVGVGSGNLSAMAALREKERLAVEKMRLANAALFEAAAEGITGPPLAKLAAAAAAAKVTADEATNAIRDALSKGAAELKAELDKIKAILPIPKAILPVVPEIPKPLPVPPIPDVVIERIRQATVEQAGILNKMPSLEKQRDEALEAFAKLSEQSRPGVFVRGTDKERAEALGKVEDLNSKIDRDKKQLAVLEEMKELLKKQVDKPPVAAEEAGFNF